MRFAPVLLTVLLLVFGLAPDAAWANTLNPHSGNAWDLHVFGNGRVIADVLTSLKLLMNPDSGDSGYRMVLLFMATVGFLVLAIAAGFNPAQNLLKMFTYVMVVWAVTFSTTKLTANITVNDPVNNYYYTVERVPALVGVPAAIVSQVGIYLTRTIETYFNIPGEFKVGGPNGDGGYYNLFNRMMGETEQFVIKNPNLKKSVSAYMGDCMVPAIAQGRIQSPVREGSVERIAYGNEALMRSTNLMETLAQARHKAIQTRHYPAEVTPESLQNLAQYTAGDEINVGMGLVVSCNVAYDLLKKDLESGAESLLNASSDAWGKTGAMVTYETAMSVALAQASSGGQNPWSNGTRPSGYILQSSMIATMSGSFRDVAAQVGNNEYMTAAAITQAEHNQKSTWSAGAQIFNNMMGYVYTTLQAFIFAIVPIVVIALMVPGLGTSIFKNYGQILVWLTMWMPMLAIINYLITLFGIEQIQGVTSIDSGLSFSNRFIVSEKTNDLMIAAQFLGTMVPLLAWGLVRGAMAFTEFISHGIGSGFAAQAGATSASGNMSLNNLSMDNTSMNKFNTAQSSAVGQQAVIAHSNAGALDVMNQLGGTGTQANSQSLTMSGTHSQSKADAVALSKSASQSMSTGTGRSANEGRDAGKSEQMSHQSQQGQQRAHSLSNTEGASSNKSVKEGENVETRDAHTQGSSVDTSKSADITMSAGPSFSGKGGGGATGAGKLAGAAAGAGAGGGGGLGMKGDAGVKGSQSFRNSDSLSQAHQNIQSGSSSRGFDQSTSLSSGASRGVTDTGSAGVTDSRTSSSDTRETMGTQASVNTGTSLSSGQSANASATWQNQVSHSTSFSRAVDIGDIDRLIDSTQAEVAMWQAGAAFVQMSDGVNGAFQAANRAIDAVDGRVAAAGGGMPGHIGLDAAGPGASSALFASAGAKVDSMGGAVAAERGGVGSGVRSVLSDALNDSKNPFSMRHNEKGADGTMQLGSGLAPAQTYAGGVAMAGFLGGVAQDWLSTRGPSGPGAPGASGAGGGARGPIGSGLGFVASATAVGAAGFAGYQFGTHVVNPAVDSLVSWATDGRESSLGGALYSLKEQYFQ